MRRLYFATGILILAILSFAAVSWAETVVYDPSDKYIVDSMERVILKAYSVQTGTGTYSAYLEVRNSV